MKEGEHIAFIGPNGEGKDEGLGNKFLANIREVDAILELILADLETFSKRKNK